jgi:hypothetical protein
MLLLKGYFQKVPVFFNSVYWQWVFLQNIFHMLSCFNKLYGIFETDTIHELWNPKFYLTPVPLQQLLNDVADAPSLPTRGLT